MENLVYLFIGLLGGHIVYHIFSAKVLTLREIACYIALWEWSFVLLIAVAVSLLFWGLPLDNCCRMLCLLAICGILQKTAVDNLYMNLVSWLSANPFGFFMVTGIEEDEIQFGRLVIGDRIMEATVMGEPLPEGTDIPVGVYIQLGKDANPEKLEVYPLNEDAEEEEVFLPGN